MMQIGKTRVLMLQINEETYCFLPQFFFGLSYFLFDIFFKPVRSFDSARSDKNIFIYYEIFFKKES